MIKHFIPEEPDPHIHTQADQTFARFGHLNSLVNQINAAESPTGLLEPYYPLGATQFLNTAGAANITSYFTSMGNATGADLAVTLADGTIAGQVKKLVLKVRTSHNMVVTPDHLTGGTHITFSAPGDSIDLMWSGTSWLPINIINIVTMGANTPIIA